MFPLLDSREKAELIYSHGLYRYYSFELDRRSISFWRSFSLLAAIFSRVFPEKRLMRFWSLHSLIFSIKSAGKLLTMLVSCDILALVTLKCWPASVCVRVGASSR